MQCVCCGEDDDSLFLLAGYESGHFLTWDISSSVILDVMELAQDATSVDYDPVTNRGIVGGPSKLELKSKQIIVI